MAASKKLIEVALPLEAINAEAAREKSIRHGHPSTLHLWWARRPLAAARAVIWSSLVDDPSAHPELYPTEEAQNAERQRLFAILEKLVSAGFAERKKLKKAVYLIPTQIGNSLITVLPEQLQSPLLTAEWEHKLKQVERGEHGNKNHPN